MFRIIIITFIYCLHFTLLSQNDNGKTVLIYSKDPGFLNLYIESKLRELPNIKTNELYFNEVSSFNTIVDDNKLQSELSKMVWKQFRAKDYVLPIPGEKNINLDKKIIDILTNYDYLLAVKTNTLGELIEFQFQLFETLPSDFHNSIKRELPRNLVDNVISTENFFINPKENGYLEQINNALKRLFVGSNLKPIVDLRIFGDPISSYETVHVPMNSEFILDGGNSGDTDTNDILYIWRNIPNEGEQYQTTNKISFDKNLPKQKINLKSAGDYRIGFRVYDGVEYSEEIQVQLRTFVKPTFYVDKQLVYSINYQSLFGRNQGPTFESQKITHYHTYHYDTQESTILITKDPLRNKYIEDNDKSKIDTLSTQTSHKNKDGHNYTEITLKSKFLWNSDGEEYFLYTLLQPSNYLSDGLKIRHKLKKRRVVNIYTEFGFSGFLPQFEGDNNKFKWYPSIAIGAFLTKNIEIEIGTPLFESKLINHEGVELFYPASLSSNLKYHIYKNKKFPEDLTNATVGIVHNAYKIPRNGNQPIGYSSLGLSVGIQATLISNPDGHGFQMDGYYSLDVSHFINNNNLSNAVDLGYKAGVAISF